MNKSSKNKNGIIFLLVFLFLIGAFTPYAKTAASIACSKDMHKIVFILQHTNFAWGYQNNGYFIDNEGKIREFDLAKKNWNPDFDTLISYLESPENSIVVGAVDLAELKQYYKILRKVNPEAEITEKRWGYDVGQQTIYGVIYNADGTHRELLLDSVGDIQKKSTDSNAKKIVSWIQYLLDTEVFYNENKEG